VYENVPHADRERKKTPRRGGKREESRRESMYHYLFREQQKPSHTITMTLGPLGKRGETQGERKKRSEKASSSRGDHRLLPLRLGLDRPKNTLQGGRGELKGAVMGGFEEGAEGTHGAKDVSSFSSPPGHKAETK